MQTVSIECQNCESVKKVEYDGVAVIGRVSEEKDLVLVHELSYYDIIGILADVAFSKEEQEGFEIALTAVLHECLSGEKTSPGKV